MQNLSQIVVETYTMGTLTADVFLALQEIFKAHVGEYRTSEPSTRAMQILYDRGFITHNNRGQIAPSERASQALYLEDSNGFRVSEPRNACDGRLVARVPSWADAAPSASAIGVAMFSGRV